MSLTLENKSKVQCWLCGSNELKLVKKSDIDSTVESKNFAITNADYGITGELSQCQNCNFIQCTSGDDVLQYYEDLVDEEYENTRSQRKLQEQRILSIIQKMKPSGTLLDIGAGSGLMVEAAIEMGYEAEGVEPSHWLQQNAVKMNLPIHRGIFPMEGLKEEYDIIALVDVIEHVNNPKELLGDIKNSMSEDGILVVITPDVKSFFARLLKWKWWHFRVAHIGYFDSKNLKMVSQSVGLKCIKEMRPSWYFNLGYLIERGYQYLPKFLRIPVPGFIKRIVVPVNLRDSLFCIYQINKEN